MLLKQSWSWPLQSYGTLRCTGVRSVDLTGQRTTHSLAASTFTLLDVSHGTCLCYYFCCAKDIQLDEFPSMGLRLGRSPAAERGSLHNLGSHQCNHPICVEKRIWPCESIVGHIESTLTLILVTFFPFSARTTDVLQSFGLIPEHIAPEKVVFVSDMDGAYHLQDVQKPMNAKEV